MKQTDIRQEKINIQRLLLVLAVFISVLPSYAQVTVGSGIPPAKGALLDIKTQTPDADNLTSTVGGMVLPRVKLVSINTLEPFIATNDPDLEALKKSHVGLTVYNLTGIAPFIIGLYVWNGQEWIRRETGGGSAFMGARNSLHIATSQNVDTVKLGGTLIKETTIFQSDKDMGFITGASGQWRVNTSDLIVFGDNNSVIIGDGSRQEGIQLQVEGNTNIDGKATVTGNTLLKDNTVIDGAFRYNYDSGDHTGKYLRAIDDNGTAEWVTPRVGEAATATGTAVGGGNQYFAFNSTNQYSTNQYIDLPPGKWLVKFTLLMKRSTTATHLKCWVTLGFARRSVYTSSTVANYEPYDKYRDTNNPAWPVYVESVLGSSYDYSAVTGEVVINNFATPGGSNPSGGTYPNNGFNNITQQLSRFDLIVIKDEEGLRPGSNPSWNWNTGSTTAQRLQLNGGASENVIVAIKLD